MTTDREIVFKQGGIDYADAMSRFGGNTALFERLAGKFLDDPHFAALEKALADGDEQLALREAHTLKGVAGNLSFTDLYHATSCVNDALREGSVSLANEHMDKVRTAYASVTSALRKTMA